MEFSLNKVEIRVLQGFGEVGGNCVVLSSKDGSLVFDQGIRFSRFRKYYNAKIQPASYNEMLKLKIIPDVQDYTTFFISHLHLDHLGLLHPLNPGSTVYVPDLKVFKAFLEPYEHANNWTVYVTPRVGIDVKGLNDNRENVVPIEVSHSAYPAYSLYYNNGYDRVLYSGDLRIYSPLKYVDEELFRKIHRRTLLEEYEEKGYDTDVLIIEGTNFSSPSPPISPNGFIEQFTAILQNHSNSLVLVSVDPIDLESILSILSLVKDRAFVVSGKRLAKMMRFWMDYLNLNLEVYQFASNDYLEFEVINAEEIKNSPQSYLVLTERGEYLEMLRKEGLDRAPVLVSLSTEVKGETGEDESVEDNWLRALGFIVYRLRISGHYYPYDLKYILETVRPRKIIPIHTEAPKTMCEYARKLGYECLLPGP